MRHRHFIRHNKAAANGGIPFVMPLDVPVVMPPVAAPLLMSVEEGFAIAGLLVSC